MKCLGPVSFEVETSEGQRIRRHQDHLRKRSQTLIWSDSSVANDLPSNNPGPSQPRQNPPRQCRRPARYT